MVKGVITQLNDLARSHTSVPKMKKVWVKKENTTHPLKGSGGDLTLCDSDRWSNCRRLSER
jgi:hypothetical protein